MKNTIPNLPIIAFSLPSSPPFANTLVCSHSFPPPVVIREAEQEKVLLNNDNDDNDDNDRDLLTVVVEDDMEVGLLVGLVCPSVFSIVSGQCVLQLETMLLLVVVMAVVWKCTEVWWGLMGFLK